MNNKFIQFVATFSTVEMETVQEEGEKGTMGKVREESREDAVEEEIVGEEEESVETRRKVDSELISNNVALVHLLKGNIGIGVMAMPR